MDLGIAAQRVEGELAWRRRHRASISFEGRESVFSRSRKEDRVLMAGLEDIGEGCDACDGLVGDD